LVFPIALSLLFEPGAYIFWLVAQVAADAAALGADILVPPLIKGRYRDAAEECRDIFGRPETVLYRVECSN
jgi:hypothetical protein